MTVQGPTEYELAASEQMRNDDSVGAPSLDAIGTRLVGEFAQAKMDRREVELRWLSDLRQYKGKYEPEEEAAMGPNRSKAYVRKTRVKVKTVDSRVADLLFPAGSEKNWEIGPTPKPSISEETRSEIKQVLQAAAGDNPITDDMLEQAIQESVKQRAAAMSRTIDDQLTESRYKKASVAAIHSGNLYGTGILKGPLVERRIRTRFVEVLKEVADGKGGTKKVRKWVMKEEAYVVPFVECTPIWNWYPDMAASTLEDCRYVFELHRMTKAKFFDLSKRKSFKKSVIVEHIKANPHGATTDEYFDSQLKALGERERRQGDNRDQFDVIERWGYIDGKDLAEAGVSVPAERMEESFFANIWVLPNGQIIKAVLQPINGVTWPYHLYYFDKDETSIFGEGIASVMRDDQKMLNAAIRMILDNGALTSGPMLEVMVDDLVSIDNADQIFPWKVWLRKRGADPSHPAVRTIELPNSLQALSAIFEIFDRNADETTAIPRYMSGENVSQGAAGTASGMSMLLAAANIVIKDLITAWDEGITRTFLEALYRWNMQFNRDPAIKGDFDVKARGTASLVAKEIRAQQLDFFAQATANPMDAPLIKRHALLRQRADAHELADVVKTEEEMKAEMESEEAKKMRDMQEQLLMAQLEVEKGKAAKLLADAEVAKRKLDEMLAKIQLLDSQAIETRVAAAYAALQAGGVATNSPYIAPAGDEILRSSGWNDQTPDPSIADLNRQPVQDSAGTQQLVQKGAGFVQQPRASTNEVPPANVDQPQVDNVAPDLQAQTGQAGVNGGIETTRIEQ